MSIWLPPNHGNKHSQLNEVMECWEEHFKTHLKTAFPHDSEAFHDIPNLSVDVPEEEPPTTE